MTIYNFGSINADYFYQVPHNPAPGQTLAATGLDHGLGGKGANQSVATVQAGAVVVHLGAVGRDGEWLLERLVSLSVATDAIARLSCNSGHAIITVAADGENAITLCSGANTAMSEMQLTQWLAPIREDDWLVMQNETTHQVYVARMARAQGAHVVYSAAPFEAKAAAEVLPFVNILCANEHEVEALQQVQRISSLASLGLDGITRQKVIDLCRAHDIPVFEPNFSLVDTYGAQTPVIEIDGRPIGGGDMGPVTRRIRGLYQDLIAQVCA